MLSLHEGNFTMRSSPPAQGSAARTSARGRSPPYSRLQHYRSRPDQIVHFLVQNGDILGQVFNLGEIVRLSGQAVIG